MLVYLVWAGGLQRFRQSVEVWWVVKRDDDVLPPIPQAGWLLIAMGLYVLFVYTMNVVVEESAGYFSDLDYINKFSCSHEVQYSTVDEWRETPIGQQSL